MENLIGKGEQELENYLDNPQHQQTVEEKGAQILSERTGMNQGESGKIVEEGLSFVEKELEGQGQ